MNHQKSEFRSALDKFKDKVNGLKLENEKLRAKIERSKDVISGMESLYQRKVDDCAEMEVRMHRQIEALKAENEQLRSALKGLLSDTQHVEHEDCEYGPCPVRTARQILKEKK